MLRPSLLLLLASACISAVPPEGSKPCTVKTFYFDDDGDGAGVATTTVEQCEAPGGYVETADDCDDADAAVIGPTSWYADADGDSFGDAGSAQSACDAPAGFVADATDCDDGSADIHPGADEHCDGVDEDCDDTLDNDPVNGSTFYTDGDLDGYGNSDASVQACSIPAGAAVASGDCDDAVATIHPNADETCNGLDDDCSGEADEDAVGEPTWYVDDDGDSYGVSGTTDKTACDAPAGYGPYPDDCDDSDSTVFPGAIESCNGGDDDCNGGIDDDAVDAATWYLDLDGDGYGITGSTDKIACDQPDDYGAEPDDCNDADATVHPGAAEACDVNVDADCDGAVAYVDGDGDGYAACIECDDADGGVHPGAAEACDTADTDCDGETRDADSVDADVWYADADGDLYGDAASGASACDVPIGYVADDTDCDDTRDDVSPAGTETCDGADIDEDCNGLADDDDTAATGGTTVWLDSDADGYGDAAGAAVFCDSPSDYVTNDEDCDDTEGAAFPGAVEVCDDGVDDDCDGVDTPCPEDYTTTYGSRMIGIPAGTFTMGGGAGDPTSAYTDHDVTLTHDFWIGETEITRGQWESWSGGVGWTYTSLPSYPCTTSTTTADCPVDSVSWYDAAQYANALSTVEGLANCYLSDGTDLAAAYLADPYACPGYRLPTEAEWEFAARADQDTTYSGSNTAADVAWTLETAYSLVTYAHRVATLAPNASGLYDMSGNVHEWTNDWYDSGYYSVSPAENPPGPASTAGHVLRGGAWSSEAHLASVSSRSYYTPSGTINFLGFRIARSSP